MEVPTLRELCIQVIVTRLPKGASQKLSSDEREQIGLYLMQKRRSWSLTSVKIRSSPPSSDTEVTLLKCGRYSIRRWKQGQKVSLGVLVEETDVSAKYYHKMISGCPYHDCLFKPERSSRASMLSRIGIEG